MRSAGRIKHYGLTIVAMGMGMAMHPSLARDRLATENSTGENRTKPGPADTSITEDSLAEDNRAAPLVRLQQLDARLQSIGWRLASANAPYCTTAQPAIGLLLQDMRGYNNPDLVRAMIGLDGDIAVQAVAKDSPAALAGLAPNDEILAIGGQDVASWPAASARDYQRLVALHDRIDELLAKTGQIALKLRPKGADIRNVVITGTPACPSRFEILTDKDDARADGARVVIGHRFGKGRSAADGLEETEYAAVVAHELAHNLLGHRAHLDDVGRNWGNIRKTEREADRLSVWLLANAGYAPEAGPRLMGGWGRKRDIGFLKVPTHDSWNKRVALMEQEIIQLRASLRQHGDANWARDFLREE